MEEKQIEDLFGAIKADDVKSFSFIMSSNENLNLCYGRFPILSLLYLYSSFKILSKFEKILMPIHNYKIYPEYYEIYRDFKLKAKKALRLFENDEIVYPVLMLAVLDERIILNKCYENLYKNESTDEKLQQIYRIRHRTGVSNTENGVVLPKPIAKPKQVFGLVLCSILLTLILAVSLFMVVFVKNNIGFGTAANPIKITSEAEFVQALKEGTRYYVLTQDINLSKDIEPQNFSGQISGNGYKIKIDSLSKGGLFNELSGKVFDLDIEVFLSEKKILNDFGLIAKTLSGVIQNCKISGNFDLTFSAEDDAFVGVFCAENIGIIANCSADVAITAKNEGNKNAYFTYFAGKNLSQGKIENCKTSATTVDAETIDIAGIACENLGLISNCENYAELSQTSGEEWHPNVAGIAIANKGEIVNCKNHADVSSKSTILTCDGDLYVFAGGIVCENLSKISSCRNFGKVTGESKISDIQIGGIVARNLYDSDNSLMGEIVSSLSNCDVVAKSETGNIIAGGIVALNSAKIENSGFVGEIDADTDATDNDIFSGQLNVKVVLMAGGLVGYNGNAWLQNCWTQCEFTQYVVGDTNLKLYGGIAGNLGITQSIESLLFGQLPSGLLYVLNNYCVTDTSIEHAAYGVDNTNSLVAQLMVWNFDVAGILISVGDIADIPLEVTYE